MSNITKWFGYPIYITKLKNFEDINLVSEINTVVDIEPELATVSYKGYEIDPKLSKGKTAMEGLSGSGYAILSTEAGSIRGGAK